MAVFTVLISHFFIFYIDGLSHFSSFSASSLSNDAKNIILIKLNNSKFMPASNRMQVPLRKPVGANVKTE